MQTLKQLALRITDILQDTLSGGKKISHSDSRVNDQEKREREVLLLRSEQ